MLLLVLLGMAGWKVKSAFSQPKKQPPVDLNALALPADSRQALLVTTDSWNDSTGMLQRLVRDETGWQAEGEPVAVTVGRHGTGWGEGLHRNPVGQMEKREGDGRAPAGIFELGTAFGYAAQAPEGCLLSYRQATERDFFVDDVKSPDYNQWVRLEEGDPTKQWASFERMKRDDALYEFGVVVNHNMNPVKAGHGSAIFLHVWSGPDTPTSGCTAMSRDNLLTLLKWLDPDRRPILIQAPVSSLTQLNSPTRKP